MYARLNVEFDEYSGESFFGEKMVEQLKKLEEMHLLEEDQVYIYLSVLIFLDRYERAQCKRIKKDKVSESIWVSGIQLLTGYNIVIYLLLFISIYICINVSFAYLSIHHYNFIYFLSLTDFTEPGSQDSQSRSGETWEGYCGEEGRQHALFDS